MLGSWRKTQQISLLILFVYFFEIKVQAQSKVGSITFFNPSYSFSFHKKYQYRKDTKPSYNSLFYSLDSLHSSIYPFLAILSLFVTIIRYKIFNRN